MLKYFSFMLLFMSFGTAYGQFDMEHFDQKFEVLKLSEEQDVVFDSLNVVYISDLQTMNETSTKNVDKYKGYKSLKKSRNSELKTLFTKEQFKSFKKIQKGNEKEVRKYFMGQVM